MKIGFIIDKGFMQSLIEKCKKELLSNLSCSIEMIQWQHELRKNFSVANNYNLIINFTTHTLFKKEYPLDNLIQIPFVSNLRSGISRELYQSIVNNDDCFLINTIKTYSGKQSFQIHSHKYLITHHSYNKTFKFILNHIPQLVLESVKRFEFANQTIWQDNHPKTIPLRKYQFQILVTKLNHYLKNTFTYNYWKTGIIDNPINEVYKNKLLLKQAQWLNQGKKRDFIADPFGFSTSKGNYIIYEKFNAAKKIGHIEVLNTTAEKVVFKLKANFHYSYPFVLEEKNEVYIIPESHQTNSVDLYKWDESKEEMEFIKTLISNFPGVDNSIIKHNNKFWLFSTTSKNKMADHQLHIFYADELTGEWKPHALNPVVTSITSSRPAGTFLKLDGKIIRPSQNSGQTYGGKIQFNEIIELTESSFIEKTIDTISPIAFKNNSIIGIHTISSFGDKTLIDAKFTGYKIGKLHF